MVKEPLLQEMVKKGKTSRLLNISLCQVLKKKRWVPPITLIWDLFIRILKLHHPKIYWEIMVHLLMEKLLKVSHYLKLSHRCLKHTKI